MSIIIFQEQTSHLQPVQSVLCSSLAAAPDQQSFSMPINIFHESSHSSLLNAL
jgi:hypothetical protein